MLLPRQCIVKPVVRRLNPIELNTEQIRLLNTFGNVTHATGKDVIVDERFDRVIFVVSPGEMGLAIGDQGVKIKKLSSILRKSVEVVELIEDPILFTRKMLASNLSDDQITLSMDDFRRIKIIVDTSKKGSVIGREGRHAEKARFLGKKYFDIQRITIDTPEGTELKW